MMAMQIVFIGMPRYATQASKIRVPMKSKKGSRPAPALSSSGRFGDGLGSGTMVSGASGRAHPDQHYTGHTQNLKQRLVDHNSGHVSHPSKIVPWVIRSATTFRDKDRGLAFERYLKTGSGRAFLLLRVTTGAAISAQLKRLKEAPRPGQSENLAQLESDIQAANLIFEG